MSGDIWTVAFRNTAGASGFAGYHQGFPRACLSDDNSPIPGLQDVLAEALGAGDPWEQHYWLRDYNMLD
jgi:hypothetical protein